MSQNYSFGYHMGSCISSLHSMCINNLLQGNCLRQNNMGVPFYSCRQKYLHCAHVPGQQSSSSCCNVHSKRLPGIGKSFFYFCNFLSYFSLHVQAFLLFPTLFSITPLRLLTSREIYISFLQFELLHAPALIRTLLF